MVNPVDLGLVDLSDIGISIVSSHALFIFISSFKVIT
jgi:hypothetical protein